MDSKGLLDDYTLPWPLFQNYRGKHRSIGPPSAARLTCTFAFPDSGVDGSHYHCQIIAPS
jgi:hypothetical protein